MDAEGLLGFKMTRREIIWPNLRSRKRMVIFVEVQFATLFNITQTQSYILLFNDAKDSIMFKFSN